MNNHFLSLSKWIVPIFIFTSVTIAEAQEDKAQRKSPPAEVHQTIGDLTITINYSQPAVRERKIWGGLVPYDKVWRTGANEATWFEVNRDVKIEGEQLPAGKYGLFTIPGEKEWIIIFNKVWDQWGSYKYDPDQDVIRVKVKPEKDEFTEILTFEIDDDGEVEMQWEKLEVDFKVTALNK